MGRAALEESGLELQGSVVRLKTFNDLPQTEGHVRDGIVVVGCAKQVVVARAFSARGSAILATLRATGPDPLEAREKAATMDNLTVALALVAALSSVPAEQLAPRGSC